MTTPTMPATIRRTRTVWGSRAPPAVATRPRRGGGAERTRVRDVVRGGSSSSSKKDKSWSPQAVLKPRCSQFGRSGRFSMTRARREQRARAEPGPDGGHGRAPDGGRCRRSCSAATGSATGWRGRLRHGLRGDGRAPGPAVAVKVIPSGPARDPERGRRGRRWPRPGSTIPGIVAVFDAGEDARARYLVSELVHGRTARRAGRRRRAVRPRRAADRPRARRRARARARPRRHPPRRQARRT